MDGSGNLYAVWQDHRGGKSQIYFAYHPAGGDWDVSEPISPTTQAQDRPSLAVNRRGEAVVAWRQGAWPTYDVFYAVRPAGGDWGAAEQRTGPGSNVLNVDVGLDDWGRVYIAWEIWDEQIFFAERSPDGSWSADEQIRDELTGSPWGIQIAVDGAGNTHAVWEDTRSGGSEIYAAYRPAGGPWSVNVRIDELAGDAWAPGLGIDGAGNAIAAWSEANRDVYGSVRYLGAGWGPSELLVAAPASFSKAPLGPHAVQSWIAGMGIGGAGVGLTLLTVGSSVGGNLNIFAQSQNAPGYNGCGGLATMHAAAHETDYTVAGPAILGMLYICHPGNGGQEPALNRDEGFLPPKTYLSVSRVVRLISANVFVKGALGYIEAGIQIHTLSTEGSGVAAAQGGLVSDLVLGMLTRSDPERVENPNDVEFYRPSGRLRLLIPVPSNIGIYPLDPVVADIRRDYARAGFRRHLARHLVRANRRDDLADPVLPHSGEFVYEQTLLLIPGRGLDYAFRLNYHSQLVYDGPLGWGWEHNYDRRFVSTGGGSLALQEGAGRFDVYSFDGADFTPPAGRYTAIVSGTTGITLTDRYGRVETYFPLDDATAPGRLRSIADRNGN